MPYNPRISPEKPKEKQAQKEISRNYKNLITPVKIVKPHFLQHFERNQRTKHDNEHIDSKDNPTRKIINISDFSYILETIKNL